VLDHLPPRPARLGMERALLEVGQHLLGDLPEGDAGSLALGAIAAALLASLMERMLAKRQHLTELSRLLARRRRIDMLHPAQAKPAFLPVALVAERPAAAAGAQSQVEPAAVMQGALCGLILALGDAPQGERIDAMKRLQELAGCHDYPVSCYRLCYRLPGN